MNKILKIHEDDNVVTCIEALKKGERFSSGNIDIIVRQDIKRFHKIAIQDIANGTLIYKYGEIIGSATEDIRQGDHVHVHNLESTRGRGDKK